MSLTKASFSMITGAYVNVLDYGAVGTANPANETADTAAFAAAMATGKNVYVPEGTYYTSSTISIGYGQVLKGAGQYKTNIYYSGSASGIYLGSATLGSLIYNCELHDLTVHCTSRASTVFGVELQNCVYFTLSNLSIFGSGNPNSSTPADRVLYGSGLYLHDNTIIGHVMQVSCRLWFQGYYLKTDAGNQSRWTASLVFDGQGELENNMRAIVVGDSTVGLYSGVGVAFRDLAIQGNYTAGINVNSGDNTVIDSCYFEGNANYDVTVGSPYGSPTPIGIKIINCTMNGADIGTTPYGTYPYIAKIYVDRGLYTSIRDNNISISSAIPLISLASGSDGASISGNRTTGTLPYGSQQISNSGTNSVIYNNHGYAVDPYVYPTLLNSWANAGSPYKSAQYQVFKNLFDQKIVMVSGSVGTGSINTTIFQLPVGLRPSGTINFAVGGGVYNNIQIDSAGNVVCTVKGSNPISLDGITFIPDQ